MIEIDGVSLLGSGTIVRHAVAMAAVTGQALHMKNARAKRTQPGLRPQHLTWVKACAELCAAQVENLSVGSKDFTFVPTQPPRGGIFDWDIGTAGSSTMLALGILPIAALADSPLVANIGGGIFQDFAPSPHHLQHVLAPLLERMGVQVDLRVVRAGYVPRGHGAVELSVTPNSTLLQPIDLVERGVIERVEGIAFSSHLQERRVSDRMADACQADLLAKGVTSDLQRTYDETSIQRGAALTVWASSSTGCIIGADCAGAPGRLSETIGRQVAAHLLEELSTPATVDRHVADMLVIFASLADGVSRYVVPHETEHVVTNIWLMNQFGASCHIEQGRVKIRGIGLTAHRLKLADSPRDPKLQT